MQATQPARGALVNLFSAARRAVSWLSAVFLLATLLIGASPVRAADTLSVEGSDALPLWSAVSVLVD